MAAMLEPVNGADVPYLGSDARFVAVQHGREGGFTLIELMVVIAIVAILLMVTVPSFREFFAAKRVEGVANELATDLQYARSEAVSRRVAVRVTFIGDMCYVVHQETLAVSSCDDVGAGVLKSVALEASNTASFTATPGFIRFEPVRGVATSSGDAVVGSSVGNSRLQIAVNPVGRLSLCVPTGYSATGYKPC